MKEEILRANLIALIKEAVQRDIPFRTKVGESEPWRIEKSDIHGKGLFATRDIDAGERVAHSADLESDEIGMDRWELSEAARYTNHAKTPNTLVDSDGAKMTMVAMRPIKEGEEIRVSYFQVGSVMAPGQQLTYNGKPMRSVTPEELTKWAFDGSAGSSLLQEEEADVGADN